MELLQLCLKMYLIDSDSWSVQLSNPCYNFDENGLATVEDDRGAFPSAFGDLVIGKGESMEWKFKLKTKAGANAIMIGVIEEDKAEKARDTLGEFFACINKTEGGRSFYCYLGTKYASHGVDTNAYIGDTIFEKVKHHNMVIMTLDMTENKGILSFKTGKFKDDEIIDHGVAFNDIDVEKKYRMAVSLWSALENVQIVK